LGPTARWSRPRRLWARRPTAAAAQAQAAGNGVGLEIARGLLREKLQGQADVLGQLPDAEEAREAVGRALFGLEEAETTERLRLAESQAAAAYWQAWAALPVPWARKDADRVPGHWRTLGARTSPLTGSPGAPPTRRTPS
jgi:CRISPR/Cas system-associated endonuclease Cas1